MEGGSLIKMQLTIMRSLLFFCYLFLLFFDWQNVPAQQLKNERSSDDLDSISVRVLYSFNQKNMEDISKFKIDTMALDIGSKWSKYYDPTINRKDSIRDSKMQNIKSMSVVKDEPNALVDHIEANKLNETIIKSDEGISYTIYKNRPNNEIYTFDRNSSGVSVLLTENLLHPNWVLISDTCQILGYLCQKADILFRGREYEAFFTQEIPLNDGPFKFYGLPGLIMKIKSKDGIFCFEAIGLQKINGEKINFKNDHQLEICKNLKQYQDFLKSKSNDAFVGFINNGNAVLYKSNPNKGFGNIEITEE